MRQQVGFVFQNFNLLPHRSVLENIIEGPVIFKGELKAEVEARARALAMRLQVILFDEPTSALDPELVGEVLNTIRALAQEKCTHGARYYFVLRGFVQWWSIVGISTEITGQRISQNLNPAYAVSLFEFLKLTFMAMSTSWYLYGLGLHFLCTKIFRQYKVALLVAAVVLNYLAAENIIPFRGPQSVAQYYLFFLLGVFWSSTMLRLSEWRHENVAPWALLAALAGVHAIFVLDKSLFMYVLALLASVAACRWLNQCFSMRCMNWIGRNTLQIYIIIHCIVIEFFGMSVILFAQRNHLFEQAWFLWL
ncbi:acyltransferase|nr:acyltransferase [Candidatus Pantoea persica]